jgi:hypothetical protein
MVDTKFLSNLWKIMKDNIKSVRLSQERSGHERDGTLPSGMGEMGGRDLSPAAGADAETEGFRDEVLMQGGCHLSSVVLRLQALCSALYALAGYGKGKSGGSRKQICDANI